MTVRLLLAVADLAAILGISTRTIRRLDAADMLPASVRLGAQPRWRRHEIESWIAAGCPHRAEWESIARTHSETAGDFSGGANPTKQRERQAK